MKQIEYYYWINSDWAYLGADRLLEIAARHHADIRYKPVRLLEVYARTGGIPLHKRSQERQDYRVAELNRWCAFLKIKINPLPKYLCPDDEAASCMVIAAMHAGYSPHHLSQAILRAEWVEERDISDLNTLIEIANGCGINGAALMQAATSEATRAELERNTEEAIARGVFGSPAYFVAGEHFWGQDRLEWVDRALSGVQG